MFLHPHHIGVTPLCHNRHMWELGDVIMRFSKREKIIYAIMLTILILLAPTVFSPNDVEGTITYETQWDWGTATPTDNGWQVVNNLGYTVMVEKGYIVSYSTQLIYCEHTHSIFDWLGSVFAAAVVHAGHNSSGDADPASVVASMVESLSQPETGIMGTVTVEEPTYCTGHYLAARGSSDGLNMPTDKDMYGVTLYIEGTYQAPDSEIAISFTAETNLANGQMRDLFAPDDLTNPIHVGIGETPVRIGIVRYLDTLFDDADFATMDSAALGKTILWSMLDDMQMVVLEGDIHR